MSTQRLRQIFASVDLYSCPNSLNFHLHTVHSDGKMQPEDLVEQAIALQLSHLAITDHHSIAGYHVAQRFLKNHAEVNEHSGAALPQLWTGVEVNASLLFTEVHILGYNFDPNHAVMQPYLQSHTTAGIDYQAINVIHALHRAGGLAVLAHPARYRRTPEELIPAAAALGIDAVETFYGYDNNDPWRPSPKQTEQIYALVEHHGLLHTCGTDSHGYKISRRL
ncbi:PHP domain-containing protein [Tumidithrix elongata RA019]|uniref:PHP domain-containing protein n=1 Tax=Tumidithrix elongata BACA0141 TaxID=2716417 RepID=A0AAW9PSQ7_9CYAN|nr:PHP domain-containing protein [Tumidithrix elongata RA019]